MLDLVAKVLEFLWTKSPKRLLLSSLLSCLLSVFYFFGVKFDLWNYEVSIAEMAIVYVLTFAISFPLWPYLAMLVAVIAKTAVGAFKNTFGASKGISSGNGGTKSNDDLKSEALPKSNGPTSDAAKFENE